MYNIFQERYKFVGTIKEVLYETQQGKCRLCGKPLENKSVLDYDHKTGIIRGLICNRCNVLLNHKDRNHHNFKNLDNSVMNLKYEEKALIRNALNDIIKVLLQDQ